MGALVLLKMFRFGDHETNSRFRFELKRVDNFDKLSPFNDHPALSMECDKFAINKGIFVSVWHPGAKQLELLGLTSNIFLRAMYTKELSFICSSSSNHQTVYQKHRRGCLISSRDSKTLTTRANDLAA